ncbi:MAG: gamma-glutamylcyclotransferase [Candidatus Thiodiazotropha sp. (ex Dulcina madagascariensis)]|nr:gamma-glutamylcyclotransferase [Candidatus Thiodiazotropha sp. (ex Dulcina madagascariensis)]
MWVYGYGSLMWDGWEKEYNCKRRLDADLVGYRRVLNKASVANWGTKQSPCPTLNIEPDADSSCRGIAFEFQEQQRHEINAYLEKREGRNFELQTREVSAQVVGAFEAVVPLYTGNNIISEVDRASMIKAARGTSGACAEYITNVHEQLMKQGIEDPEISALWRAVHGQINRAEFEQARNFMFTDIHREVALANASDTVEGQKTLARLGISPGGGNFMAALALLSYTEFGGKLKFACKTKKGKDFASENFNLFFDELGPAYRTFRADGHNVYDIFRCGLAHEYYIKRSCTISMRVDPMSAPGIGLQSEDKFYFAVEPYCRDLEQAFFDMEHYLYGQ